MTTGASQGQATNTIAALEKCSANPEVVRHLWSSGGSGKELHHYESEYKDMPKVRFHPIVEWFRGKMGDLVFRRAHNGTVSVYMTPDMSGVEWSQAQKDHRQHMKEAWLYASAAVADPDLRPIYVQMTVEKNKNPRRPFDVAVSDYCETGNDLLWKKHMGDKEKPKDWKIERYSWYLTKRKRRR